jgi:hypothetical protein
LNPLIVARELLTWLNLMATTLVTVTDIRTQNLCHCSSCRLSCCARRGGGTENLGSESKNPLFATNIQCLTDEKGQSLIRAADQMNAHSQAQVGSVHVFERDSFDERC